MELFNIKCEPNAVTPELIDKYTLYNSDPYTLRVKKEFILLDSPTPSTKTEVDTANGNGTESSRKHLLSETPKAENTVDNEKSSKTDKQVVGSEGSVEVGEAAKKASGYDSQRRKKFKNEQANKQFIREVKLCPHLSKCEKCQFGTACKYNHDIAEWMKIRPADLGPVCHLFATYGRCPYGIACRFSGHHIVVDAAADRIENIVDEAKQASFATTSTPTTLTTADGDEQQKQQQQQQQQQEQQQQKKRPPMLIYNVLNGELKGKLWKKKYDFTRALQIVRVVDNYYKDKALHTTTLKYNHNRSCLEWKTPGAAAPAVATIANVAPSEAEKSVPTEETVGDVKVEENVTDATVAAAKRVGVASDEDLVKLRRGEKKTIDWRNKLYLAPLTTNGNLPFRRICKEFGADITCSEMAMASNLLTGQVSEWALIKRHESEDLFGVQLAGSFSDTMCKAAQVLDESMSVDFIDINAGCPIDIVFEKGGGAALMTRIDHFKRICRALDICTRVPITAKIRTGIKENVAPIAHDLIGDMRNDWGLSMITLHGRTRQQRYSKLADWQYIAKCAQQSDPVPLFGCGDILSYQDYNEHMAATNVAGCMIARGALYKPWLFTEIKQQRDWDISSSERFDILKKFVNYGLENWGSDTQGVERTRRFLLEWLSFLYRYVPVGVLETLPQRINLRPPTFFGRDELETLMASPHSTDWIRISEMLLGPVPPGFQFSPKHKANAY